MKIKIGRKEANILQMFGRWYAFIYLFPGDTLTHVLIERNNRDDIISDSVKTLIICR